MLWLLCLFQCKEYIISSKLDKTVNILITTHKHTHTHKDVFKSWIFHTDNLEGNAECTKWKLLLF